MRRRAAFTIVELMVAMVLLGALSAIAVPRYRTYKERAYVAAMRTDLGHLRIAEESHLAEFQVYAADTTALDFRHSSEVRIALSSQDLMGGYTAVATHLRVPSVQCQTAMGREASPAEAGAIYCRPAGGGAGTLPGAP